MLTPCSWLKKVLALPRAENGQDVQRHQKFGIKRSLKAK